MGDVSESVAELQDRPSTRTMALPCIYGEIEALLSRVEDADHDELDAIRARFGDIAHWLEARLDVEYPSCPECGDPIKRTDDGTPICYERHHELPEDVLEEFERVDGRLWGTRGHNGGAR